MMPTSCVSRVSADAIDARVSRMVAACMVISGSPSGSGSERMLPRAPVCESGAAATS
jgi:hypothetical protein